MKKITIRLICALLCALMSFPLISCEEQKNEGKKKDEVLLTVAGVDITYDCYKCIYQNSRAVYPDLSDDELKEKMLSDLRSAFAVYTVCREHGVETDGDNVDLAVENSVAKAVMEAGGEEEFKKQLEDNNMTEDFFRLSAKTDYLTEEAYYALISDGTLEDDPEKIREIIDSDKFAAVLQVLIRSENSVSAVGGTLFTPAVSHTDEEAEAIAKEVREKALSGADFNELVSKYGESLYMMDNADGYYICHGMWDDVNENAVFALSVGEISEVIKSDAGYSVFKRIEKSDEYINENFDSISRNYQSAVYTLILEDAAGKTEIKTTEKYDSLKLSDIK